MEIMFNELCYRAVECDFEASRPSSISFHVLVLQFNENLGVFCSLQG